jgi:hypothetical protein
MHPVYVLALVTLVIALGVAAWSLASTRRNLKTGGKTSGLGGPNDPMA